MTVTEANAANDVAREVLALAEKGVSINETLEGGVAISLINANKRLQCGFSDRSFLEALAAVRKKAVRS